MPKFRVAGVAIFVATCLVTAACSEEVTQSPDATAGSSEIAAGQFINPLPQHPVWGLIGDCMVEEAEAQGIDFTQTGPSGQAVDATVMVQQIQQAMAAEKDLIVTFPASEAFAPLLERAKDAGAITITMYGDASTDSGAYTNVGADWNLTGHKFVEAISERPGPQKVGLIAHSDTGLGKAWMDGMKDAAKETDNVEIVAETYTADDSAKALPQATALLTANPEINVLASHMGTATQGTVAAIKNTGNESKVVFVGNGPDSGGKEALAEGIAYRMLIQNLCSAGKMAISVAQRVAQGEDVEQTYDVETAMASKENVDELMEKGWR